MEKKKKTLLCLTEIKRRISQTRFGSRPSCSCGVTRFLRRRLGDLEANSVSREDSPLDPWLQLCGFLVENGGKYL